MAKGVTFSLLIFIAIVCQVHSYTGIGDRVWHTFLDFQALPLNTTAAIANGWTPSSTCDPNLGIAYSNGDPIIAYYTKAGQIAGVGLLRYDTPLSSLIPNYWKPNNSSYEITVSFRSSKSDIMCNGKLATEEIGEGLWINQDSINMPIPLTKEQAIAQEWTQGGCITILETYMGTHWSYDIETHPKLSHKTANLLPIVPMFNHKTGNVNAFFVQADAIEKVYPLGVWEGPLTSSLFCNNFCPPCTFDSWFFSTLHFALSDPTLNTCDGATCVT